MSSINWGNVKEHRCPSCGRWMVAFKKNEISEHNNKGSRCLGVGKKPSHVKAFNGEIYDDVD